MDADDWEEFAKANPGIAVGVICGEGLDSLPWIAHLHHDGKAMDLYHYTDIAGFEGLTAEHAQWLPSLGVDLEPGTAIPVPGHELPPEEILSRPDVSNDVSALFAVVLSGASQAMLDLSNTRYGPGWYMTDLSPNTSTQQLLAHLWGGDPRKLPRTRYWVRVALSEFKVRVPNPAQQHVRFMPLADKLFTSTERSLCGQSLSSVIITAAGSRTDSGRVEITHTFKNGKVLIPPLQFLIEGWARLPEDSRKNLSDLPCIPPPTKVAGQLGSGARD